MPPAATDSAGKAAAATSEQRVQQQLAISPHIGRGYWRKRSYVRDPEKRHAAAVRGSISSIKRSESEDDSSSSSDNSSDDEVIQPRRPSATTTPTKQNTGAATPKKATAVTPQRPQTAALKQTPGAASRQASVAAASAQQIGAAALPSTSASIPSSSSAPCIPQQQPSHRASQLQSGSKPPSAKRSKSGGVGQKLRQLAIDTAHVGGKHFSMRSYTRGIPKDDVVADNKQQLAPSDSTQPAHRRKRSTESSEQSDASCTSSGPTHRTLAIQASAATADRDAMPKRRKRSTESVERIESSFITTTPSSRPQKVKLTSSKSTKSLRSSTISRWNQVPTVQQSLPSNVSAPTIYKPIRRNAYSTAAAQSSREARAYDDAHEHCHCEIDDDEEDASGCGNECELRGLQIECNPNTCPTKQRCTNQRFQQQTQCKLNIQHCGKTGWGLFIDESCGAGRLICEYRGEVITNEEVDDRLGRKKHTDCLYLMHLHDDLTIDATDIGGVARFCNHSCRPNCRTEKWQLPSGQQVMGIFSRVPLKRGEEVTIDYRFDRWGTKQQVCHCQEENCRGDFGVDQQQAAAAAAQQLRRQQRTELRDLKTQLAAMMDADQSARSNNRRRSSLELKIKHLEELLPPTTQSSTAHLTAANLKQDGGQCHSCRFPHLKLYTCQFATVERDDDESDTDTDLPTIIGGCDRRFCITCIHEIYKEQPTVEPVDGVVGLSWPCIVCRGVCPCALCKSQLVKTGRSHKQISEPKRSVKKVKTIALQVAELLTTQHEASNATDGDNHYTSTSPVAASSLSTAASDQPCNTAATMSPSHTTSHDMCIPVAVDMQMLSESETPLDDDLSIESALEPDGTSRLLELDSTDPLEAAGDAQVVYATVVVEVAIGSELIPMHSTVELPSQDSSLVVVRVVDTLEHYSSEASETTSTFSPSIETKTTSPYAATNIATLDAVDSLGVNSVDTDTSRTIADIPVYSAHESAHLVSLQPAIKTHRTLLHQLARHHAPLTDYNEPNVLQPIEIA